MHLDQVTPADRIALESLAQAANAAAADSLARLLGEPVEPASTTLRLNTLGQAVTMVGELPQHANIIYLRVSGDVSGQMVLVLPSTTAILIARLLLSDERSWLLDAERRDGVLAEVGNIVLTSFVNRIADTCGLRIEPTTPLIASEPPAAVLEGPLAAAAADGDLVVSFESGMVIGSGIGSAMRAPFHLLFLPTPGSLSQMLHHAAESDATPRQIPVRMGELVVTRRTSDSLIANALGSCIGLALVDRLNRVAAMAHVMLPASPQQQHTRIAGIPTLAARYADTALPALLAAFEQAGGRRLGASAYLVGGAQMFRGELADTMDVGRRNIAAIQSAARAHNLHVAGHDLGGSASRSLEVEMQTGAVWVRIDSGLPIRLDLRSASAPGEAA